MQIVKKIQLLIAGLSLSLSVNAADPDLALVVSSSSRVETMSVAEAADIFLGRSTRFPDGSLARPVDQAAGTAERAAFYSRLAGKNPAQMKAHWSALIFTGRGQPPTWVNDSNAVKNFLANNPNGIGYIDRQTIDEPVVVIHVLESSGPSR